MSGWLLAWSTCSKRVRRYRQEGEAGLVGRCSVPQRVANRTEEDTIRVIAALRRLRFTGPEISELLDRPLSTVSGILQRIGMGRLGRLGLEAANRYERQRAGELIHVDVKRAATERDAGSERFPLVLCISISECQRSRVRRADPDIRSKGRRPP